MIDDRDMADPGHGEGEAEEAELGAVAELVADYWRFENLAGFDRARVVRTLRCLRSRPALGRVLVARRDGAVCAYLVLVWVFSLEHGGLTAEIGELYVVPTWRGRGTGAGLLALAENLARRAGCRNLSLQVGRENPAARDFYTRLGFRRRAGYELLEKDLPESA